MTERHVRAYLKSEYGEMQITKINNKINEANRKGHSSPLYRDLKELLKCNRMGEKESCMPFDEVIQCYFK